jgi:phosphoribosylformylglycinamidine (FGAM) synthase-like enzyme
MAARNLHGRSKQGEPPKVDLADEKLNGEFVRQLIADGIAVTAVHDISDGGLLVAVAEMALAGGYWCAAGNKGV